MGPFIFRKKNKNMHLLFKKGVTFKIRWGARAVEWDGLENRYVRKGIVSSNLTPTANFQNSDFGRLLPRPAKDGARLPPRF